MWHAHVFLLVALVALYVFYKILKGFLPSPSDIDHSYEGPVDAHGNYHGFGKLEISNGDVYEGYFSRGTFHGRGNYTFSDGGTHEGWYHRGKFHGFGRQTFSNGDVYEGNFVDGKRHSTPGRFVAASGTTYLGGFRDGSKHGKGYTMYPDGRRFKGHWVQGKRHGKGIYWNVQGVAWKGQWEDGVRVSALKKIPPCAPPDFFNDEWQREMEGKLIKNESYESKLMQELEKDTTATADIDTDLSSSSSSVPAISTATSTITATKVATVKNLHFPSHERVLRRRRQRRVSDTNTITPLKRHLALMNDAIMSDIKSSQGSDIEVNPHDLGKNYTGEAPSDRTTVSTVSGRDGVQHPSSPIIKDVSTNILAQGTSEQKSAKDLTGSFTSLMIALPDSTLEAGANPGPHENHEVTPSTCIEDLQGFTENALDLGNLPLNLDHGCFSPNSANLFRNKDKQRVLQDTPDNIAPDAKQNRNRESHSISPDDDSFRKRALPALVEDSNVEKGQTKRHKKKRKKKRRSGGKATTTIPESSSLNDESLATSSVNVSHITSGSSSMPSPKLSTISFSSKRWSEMTEEDDAKYHVLYPISSSEHLVGNNASPVSPNSEVETARRQWRANKLKQKAAQQIDSSGETSTVSEPLVSPLAVANKKRKKRKRKRRRNRRNGEIREPRVELESTDGDASSTTSASHFEMSPPRRGPLRHYPSSLEVLETLNANTNMNGAATTDGSTPLSYRSTESLASNDGSIDDRVPSMSTGEQKPQIEVHETSPGTMFATTLPSMGFAQTSQSSYHYDVNFQHYIPSPQPEIIFSYPPPMAIPMPIINQNQLGNLQHPKSLYDMQLYQMQHLSHVQQHPQISHQPQPIPNTRNLHHLPFQASNAALRHGLKVPAATLEPHRNQLIPNCIPAVSWQISQSLSPTDLLPGPQPDRDPPKRSIKNLHTLPPQAPLEVKDSVKSNSSNSSKLSNNHIEPGAYPPWLFDVPKSKCRSPNDEDTSMNETAHARISSLTQEIQSYSRYILGLGRSRVPLMDKVLQAVAASTKKLWPQSWIKTYGSSVTGLMLPSSDIDLVVFGYSRSAEDGSMEAAEGGEVKQSDVSALYRLTKHLDLEEWTSKVICLPAARFPVLKLLATFGDVSLPVDITLAHSESFITVDSTIFKILYGKDKSTSPYLDPTLSFGCEPGDDETAPLSDDSDSENYKIHSGITSVALIRRYIGDMPQIQPLALVLKQLLVEQGLDNTFTGGLSSYCLVLMLVAFLKSHPTLYPHRYGSGEPDLGVLLIDVLDMYGWRFQPNQTGIHIRFDQSSVNHDRKEATNCFYALSDRSSTLVLKDPICPFRNLGSGVFGMFRISGAFTEALSRLMWTNSQSAIRLSQLAQIWCRQCPTLLSRIVTGPGKWQNRPKLPRTDHNHAVDSESEQVKQRTDIANK